MQLAILLLAAPLQAASVEPDQGAAARDLPAPQTENRRGRSDDEDADEYEDEEKLSLRERREASKRKRLGIPSPFREDVVNLKDGTVYRGVIMSQQEDLWLVRLAGGTILSLHPDEVDTVYRERRFAHETAHGHQFLLRLGLGFEADIGYARHFDTFAGLSTELGLGWSPHHNIELEACILKGPSSWKGAGNVRFFFAAQEALKAYGMTGFILGGDQNSSGLRLATGFQVDTGRHLGFFFHHGATVYVEGEDDGVYLGYHMEIGTQLRL